MVSMFANHFFNWVNQLKGSQHQVYWIDVFDNGSIVKNIEWVEQTVNWKRKYDFPGRQYIKQKHPQFYEKIQLVNERKLATILEQKIKEINPDVIQSFVLFSACAPILDVMLKYRKIKWIYSAWGNDLFYFQNEPDYLKDIKKVLPRVDFMFADCKRDYEIALEYGFCGKFLGVFPGGGGFDFEKSNPFILPVEERKLILIKGYQDLFGECIPVLKAVQNLKSELADYGIVVFGSESKTIKYIGSSELRNWPNFSFFNKIGRNELMELMGRSLVYIGNSISDGTPNTLLEAIVMGAFPIQSNPGGATAEIITHQKNGFLIDDPLDVNEIEQHILKAINNKSFLKDAVAYNYRTIKPKLERSYVKTEVIEKYKQTEESILRERKNI